MIADSFVYFVSFKFFLFGMFHESSEELAVHQFDNSIKHLQLTPLLYIYSD